MNPEDVKDFEDCRAAGYQVLETYPRQCKTPDGRTFTSETDLFDSMRDITCSDDHDCQLVNRRNGFSCCFKGRCDQVDYSQPEMVTVNRDWYGRMRRQHCPPEEECGPPPTCPAKTPFGGYKAACINGRCMKIAAT